MSEPRSRKGSLPPLPAKLRKKSEFWRRQVSQHLESDSYSLIGDQVVAEICKVFRFFDELAVLAERTIREVPDAEHGYAWRTCVLMMTDGDSDDLEHAIAAWLERAPQSGQAWGARAHFENRRGNRQGARECLEQAIRLEPNNHGLYLNLAACLLEDKETEAALLLARQAVAMGPSSVLANVIVAEAHLQADDLVAAHEVAQAALDLDPDHLSALKVMTQICCRLGLFERALQSFRRFEALSSDDLAIQELRWELRESETM